MAKKTQVQLLEEIAELLKPISNMASYNIRQINQQMANEQLLLKAQQEAAEAQKANEDSN